MRNSVAIEGESVKRKDGSPPGRMKTLAGRKLRIMTVEEGLLREIKVVQRMIDALCECRVRLSFFSPEPWFLITF
jgi:hypothetical protein